MSDTGSDIIIKGGSVELEYDGTIYTRDPSDPKKNQNPTKKITHVVISGDISYDSGDNPNGLRCEIKLTCK
ncbi:MAG: hypothetical protein AABN95_17330 [Acidobacteriota bacterium]